VPEENLEKLEHVQLKERLVGEITFSKGNKNE